MKPHSHRSIPALASMAAALPALFSAASAEPVVEDPFPTGAAYYTTGSSIVGQSTFAAGFTGAWLDSFTSGGTPPEVAASGLSYSSGGQTVASTMGAVSYPGAGPDGRIGRLLAQDYHDETTEDVYFSFMVQLDAVELSYRAVELHQGGFDDTLNRKLQIAVGEDIGSGQTSNFTVRLFNSNSLAADLGAADTSVNFFVGKISFVGGVNDADSIKIWRNPTLASEPITGDFSADTFNLQVDRVSIANFSSDGIVVDEIRFGPTWADVTAADSEPDGMRDSWENISPDNDLDDSTDDTALDKDMDGLLNLDEYLRKTKANIAIRTVNFQVNMRPMEAAGKFDPDTPPNEVRIIGDYWDSFSTTAGIVLSDVDMDGIYEGSGDIEGPLGSDFGGYKAYTNSPTADNSGYETGSDRTTNLGTGHTLQTINLFYFRTDDDADVYLEWADAYGLDLGDSESDMSSNPDGDNDDNETEFFFGANPNSPDSLPQTVTKTATDIVITWLERHDAGITYTLTEDTLLDGSWETSTATPADSGDQSGVPFGYVRREATVPIDDPKKFLQIVGELP